MKPMNPLILTKIAKFTLIGSTSAFLSFAAKGSPKIQVFAIYLYIGLVAIFLIAILWEGRQQVVSSDSTEEGLNQLMTSLTSVPTSKPKRQYLLSPSARLELVIAIVITTICALVGAI